MKTNYAHELVIKNLHVAVAGKEILRGVTFAVKPGQVHAIMGPNGSGKSTLAYALMGHPIYKIKDPFEKTQDRQKLKIKSEKQIVQSHIYVNDIDVIEMKPEERAKAGLFLALQSPIVVPGVTVSNLLRTAYQELYKDAIGGIEKTVQNPVLVRRWSAGGMTIVEFTKNLTALAGTLHIDESFLRRGINDGFSGGEKKKLEMLQALVLKPKYAIFDEIDTGLDVDALKIVAAGIAMLKKQGTGVIIITHYQRILKYIQPDVVHVFVDGRIVKTGKKGLAKQIEESGYNTYTGSH